MISWKNPGAVAAARGADDRRGVITDKDIASPEPTCLYRAFDVDGNLLYVGIGNTLKKRLAKHRIHSWWWHDMAEVTTREYPTRGEVREVTSGPVRAAPPATRGHRRTHPDGQPLPSALLTPDEHRIVSLLGEAFQLLAKIIGGGDEQVGREDAAEMVHHIHGIQRAVMAQAAGRAYPDLYRLLGRRIRTAGRP